MALLSFINKINLKRREERTSVDDGSLRARTDSSCCASSYSPHKHVCARTHTVPESILLQPHLQKHEGIPPLSPRLKPARPRPLNSDLGREHSPKIRSRHRHFKETCPADKASTKGGVRRVQDRIHHNHINHRNYFPLLLKSHRMQDSREIIRTIQSLTDG